MNIVRTKITKNIILLIVSIVLVVINADVGHRSSSLHIYKTNDISNKPADDVRGVEFLNVIVAAAKFYINNVPTYVKTMKNNDNYFYETRLARDNIRPFLKVKIKNELPSYIKNNAYPYFEPDEAVEDNTKSKIWVNYGERVNKYKVPFGFEYRILDRYQEVDCDKFEYKKNDKKTIEEAKKKADASTAKIYEYNSSYWYKWREYFVAQGKRDFVSAHMLLNGYEMGQQVSKGSITEHARDDCSGFVKFVLDIFLNNKYLGAGTIERDFVCKELLSVNNKISKELMAGGFTAYQNDTSLNFWDKYRFEKKETGKALTINDLVPGDMLVCDTSYGKKYKIYVSNNDNPEYRWGEVNSTASPHIEFYVGNHWEVEYNDMSFDGTNDYGYNFEEYEKKNVHKKSGINFISCNGLPTKGNNKAEGTFSWGNIADEFPLEATSGQKHYFYKTQDMAFFKHCECGALDPNEMVVLCKDESKANKEIRAYTHAQYESKSNLTKLTPYFPVHDLSSKGCYFCDRKYKILWRQE